MDGKDEVAYHVHILGRDDRVVSVFRSIYLSEEDVANAIAVLSLLRVVGTSSFEAVEQVFVACAVGHGPGSVYG